MRLKDCKSKIKVDSKNQFVMLVMLDCENDDDEDGSKEESYVENNNKH